MVVYQSAIGPQSKEEAPSPPPLTLSLVSPTSFSRTTFFYALLQHIHKAQPLGEEQPTVGAFSRENKHTYTFFYFAAIFKNILFWDIISLDIFVANLYCDVDLTDTTHTKWLKKNVHIGAPWLASEGQMRSRGGDDTVKK